VEVGKELLVDEVAEVIACHSFVVVYLAGFVLGRGPALPPVRLVQDEGVFLPLQFGFHGFVLFQRVEIFQEEQPRSLLGIVEFGGATRLFPENVVDILEGLFEHGCLFP